MKTPQFHKFFDPETHKPRAQMLDESHLAQYLMYVDSPFTTSNVTFESDTIQIRKYVTPVMRMTATFWRTQVMYVATLKSNRAYKYIASYGSIFYNADDKFDDRQYKEVLRDAVLANWGINLGKLKIEGVKVNDMG